jgi:hypothetical protein
MMNAAGRQSAVFRGVAEGGKIPFVGRSNLIRTCNFGWWSQSGWRCWHGWWRNYCWGRRFISWWALGGAVAGAYLSEVEDVDIQKVRNGKDPALILVDGFMTQHSGDPNLGLTGLGEKYEDRAIYYVCWESGRLSDIGTLLLSETEVQRRWCTNDQ